MAMEDERTISKDTRLPPGAKALMILVAVVTLLAVWLVPGDKKEVPPALPELATSPKVDQGEDTAIVRSGDRARAIIAKLRAENEEPDPGEVFTQAEQLQSESQLDDAYLLYRFAARQGHAQAALVLGSQADPAFYAAETSILPKPDPQQAYKWYRVAAAAGNEDAVARLKGLREQVEQSAADGNEPARRLMLQWQ